MKKLLIVSSIACILLASCGKTVVPPNTVTIQDGDYTFSESAGPVTEPGSGTSALQPGVSVLLSKGISGADSLYALSVIVCTGQAYALSFRNAYATSPGSGVYTLRPQDSAANTYLHLTQADSSGIPYKISGGTIQLTSAGSKNVAGTFTLNIFNVAGSATITGSLSARQPTISY